MDSTRNTDIDLPAYPGYRNQTFNPYNAGGSFQKRDRDGVIVVEAGSGRYIFEVERPAKTSKFNCRHIGIVTVIFLIAILIGAIIGGAVSWAKASVPAVLAAPQDDSSDSPDDTTVPAVTTVITTAMTTLPASTVVTTTTLPGRTDVVVTAVVPATSTNAVPTLSAPIPTPSSYCDSEGTAPFCDTTCCWSGFKAHCLFCS